MSKRINGEGSLRKRHDGLWEARYHVVESSGAVSRLSLYARTRREAASKLRAATRTRDEGLHAPTNRDTVATFMPAWLEDAAPTLRPTSLRRYRQLVEQHVIPELGRRRLVDLRPEHVQALYTRMGRAGLSPATIQTTHAVLHRAFGRALRWGKVARNVVDVVDAPRAERVEALCLNSEQARRVLRLVEPDRLCGLMTLAITVGLRRGELLALQWDAVDLDHASLEVRYTMRPAKGGGELAEPKTRTSRRRVPLDPRTVAVLRAHRARQLEERLAAANVWQERGFVFTTPTGQPIPPMQVTRAWSSVLARAELPAMPFHATRHTAASLMAEVGVNPRVSAEVLGHASASMTLDRYTHASDSLRRQAATSVGDVIWSDDSRAATGAVELP